MAKYRPIFTRIWKDPDFEEMDNESKLIFIYLCTNDLTTDSGIYSISLKTISNETGIPLGTVRERLTNGSIKNLLYDEQFKYVFVVKFKKYNAGGKPELVEKGIVNDYKTSNCTYLWNKFIKEYPKYKDAILTVGQPLPNPDKSSRTKPIPKPIPKPKKALFTDVNKAPVSGGHFSKQVDNYAEPIIKTCKKILKLPQKNGKRFNPFQWVQSQTNNNMHPGAILESIEALQKYWKDIRDGPWAYASSVIKTKNGNWNERSHIAEAEKFKTTWISPEVKELIKNIGS